MYLIYYLDNFNDKCISFRIERVFLISCIIFARLKEKILNLVFFVIQFHDNAFYCILLLQYLYVLVLVQATAATYNNHMNPS